MNHEKGPKMKWCACTLWCMECNGISQQMLFLTTTYACAMFLICLQDLSCTEPNYILPVYTFAVICNSVPCISGFTCKFKTFHRHKMQQLETVLISSEKLQNMSWRLTMIGTKIMSWRLPNTNTFFPTYTTYFTGLWTASFTPPSSSFASVRCLSNPPPCLTGSNRTEDRL